MSSISFVSKAIPVFDEIKKQASPSLYPLSNAVTTGSSVFVSASIGHLNSAFSQYDQNRLTEVIIEYLDVIPDQSLMDRLKYYERKYKKNSVDFLDETNMNVLPSSPDLFEWKTIYSTLNRFSSERR